jgi:hypothetical protein
MDECPCRFMSDGRWRLSAVLLPCPQHETDRRTSRPSTGGASILRRDAGRRRSRQKLPDGGPPNATTEEQLKNNRIAHNERIAHHNRISNCFAATGRSRVGTSSGLAVSGVGQGAARRPFDSRAPLMHIRRRPAGAVIVMQLGCISSCGGSSRDIDPPGSDGDPLARSASRDAAEAHHGRNLSAPPICMHHL